MIDETKPDTATQEESLGEQIGRRVPLALWIALFLLLGLDVFHIYLQYREWLSMNSAFFDLRPTPWAGYFVLGLALVIPLLILASKRVADLGFIRLTVYTGFFIVITNYLLYFKSGFSLVDMMNPLPLNTSDAGNTTDVVASSYMNIWNAAGYFIMDGVRFLAYLGLGYIVAERKGLPFSTAIIVLVALMDSAFVWLVLIPIQVSSELELWTQLPHSVWNIFRAWLPVILLPFATQAIIFIVVGLAGAIIARVRRPGSSGMNSNGAIPLTQP